MLHFVQKLHRVNLANRQRKRENVNSRYLHVSGPSGGKPVGKKRKLHSGIFIHNKRGKRGRGDQSGRIKKRTSRIAVKGVPSSSWSLITFRATTWFVKL